MYAYVWFVHVFGVLSVELGTSCSSRVHTSSWPGYVVGNSAKSTSSRRKMATHRVIWGLYRSGTRSEWMTWGSVFFFFFFWGGEGASGIFYWNILQFLKVLELNQGPMRAVRAFFWGVIPVKRAVLAHVASFLRWEVGWAWSPTSFWCPASPENWEKSVGRKVRRWNFVSRPFASF